MQKSNLGLQFANTERVFVLAVLIGTMLGANAQAERSDKLGALFEERIRTLVAVEFFVQLEIERRP